MDKEKKEGKKVIDFTKVEVVNVDGSKQQFDLSKEVASQLYNRSQNVEEATAAMDLYKTGKCGYSEELKDSILNILNSGYFIWPARQGIIKALGGNDNAKN